jgi:hypothetical protein
MLTMEAIVGKGAKRRFFSGFRRVPSISFLKLKSDKFLRSQLSPKATLYRFSLKISLTV